MNRLSPDDSIPAPIRRAAAAWIALRDGGFTPAHETEFAAWLVADERNAAAFVEIDDTWNTLDRLEVVRPREGEADPNLLFRGRPIGSARPGSHALLPRIRKHVLPIGLAAAAAVVIGVVALWRDANSPAIATAQHFVVHAATDVGASRKLDLPDGSVVHLNTDTAIDVVYGAKERRLRLVRGEAHFVVAKDPRRPFVVRADRIDVRAVGTAFNVRMESATVEVLVTEGKVRVDDTVEPTSLIAASAPPAKAKAPPVGHDRSQGRNQGDKNVLRAGQRAVIVLSSSDVSAVTQSPSVTVASIPAEETSRTLAWQLQRLEFESTPLAEVVEEFNRYNRHKLVLADNRLRGMRFDGTFRTDGYDALVRLLESHFNVSAERGESRTLLRLSP